MMMWEKGQRFMDSDKRAMLMAFFGALHPNNLVERWPFCRYSGTLLCRSVHVIDFYLYLSTLSIYQSSIGRREREVGGEAGGGNEICKPEFWLF